MSAMARSDRPPLRPLGPTLRAVREQLNLTQQEAADAIGLRGGQASMSPREMDPSHTRAIEPRPDELVRFEDKFGLQRGTVLRLAGYVVDALDPVELVDSWTFLNTTEREIVRDIIRRAMEREPSAGSRPGRSQR